MLRGQSRTPGVLFDVAAPARLAPTVTQGTAHAAPSAPLMPVGASLPRDGAFTAPPAPYVETTTLPERRPGTAMGGRRASSRVSPSRDDWTFDLPWDGEAEETNGRDHVESAARFTPQAENAIAFDWSDIVGDTSPAGRVVSSPPQAAAETANDARRGSPQPASPPRYENSSSYQPHQTVRVPGAEADRETLEAAATSPPSLSVAKDQEKHVGADMLQKIQQQARSVREGVASTVAAIVPALRLSTYGAGQGEGRGQTLSEMIAPKRGAYSTSVSRRPARMNTSLSAKAADLQVKQMLIKRLRELSKMGVELSIEETSFHVVSCDTLKYELRTAVSTLQSEGRAQSYTRGIFWAARMVTTSNYVLELHLPGLNTYFHKVRAFMDRPLSRYQLHQLVAMWDTSVTHPLRYFGMGMVWPIVVAVGARLSIFLVGLLSPFKAKLAERLWNVALAVSDSQQETKQPQAGETTTNPQPHAQKRSVVVEVDDDEDDDDLAPPSARPAAGPPSRVTEMPSAQPAVDGVGEWVMPP